MPTTEDLRSFILGIIASIDDEADIDDIDDEVVLRDQFDLDYIDFLHTVMEIRKQKSIQIPEEDYPKLGTLKSSVEYLQERLGQ